MKLQATPLAGLYDILYTPGSDTRGRFTRLFCEQELAAIRPNLHFAQINLSETTHAGSVRGMHFQVPPAAEAKVIRCLRGRVFDVAVDVRADSPTFLQWHAVELADDNDRAVFIPEGFAHGFQTLTDSVHLLYMHTTAWTPECEAGLLHDDPRVAVDWPLPVRAVSEKDRSYHPIDHTFSGMRL